MAPTRDERLAKMWMESRLGTEAIAAVLLTSRTSVRRMAARLGLPYERPLVQRKRQPKLQRGDFDIPEAEIYRRASEIRSHRARQGAV